MFGEGKLELGEAFNDSRHDNLHRLFDPEINSIIDSVPIYGDMLKSVLNLTKSLTMRITYYETTLFGDPSLSFFIEEGQQKNYEPTEITIPASRCSNKSQGWVAHDNGSDLYADKAGEWVEYMIDIPSDGKWQICLYGKNKNIRRGFNLPGRYEFKLKMYVDDRDKGQFQIPPDASNYASGSKAISLTKGMHKIKFKWTNNLYWNGIINKWDSNLQAFIVVIKKQV